MSSQDNAGAMFTRVAKRKLGYNPGEVDDFFTYARDIYEGRKVAKDNTALALGTSFDLVRGGYATAEVDAALDRITAAFVSLDQRAWIAEQGQGAWDANLVARAQTLYGRLSRPAGERFAPARRGQPAYDREQVDEVCDRLIGYFDQGTPLSASTVQSALFRTRTGRRGYDEASVDAFLRRAAEVLLAAS